MRSLHRTVVFTLVMTCIALAPVLGQEAGSGETADIKALRETLQKKAAEFPTVALNTDLKTVAFQTVDLSQTLTPVAGKKYYAFRFKTPDQPGQLIWSFVVPMHAFEWYIVPVRGKMKGFTHFDKYFLPGDIKGVGKQNDCMALQRLPAETFKAASEYIIWFSFDEKVTPKVTFSLNMLSGENLEYSKVFTWFTQGNP